MYFPVLLASVATLSSVTALTSVSNSAYSEIERFTQYAAAAYAENCPQIPNGASIVKRYNVSDVDLAAIVFYEPSSNQVILSFRGSATATNLDDDFYFDLVPLSVTGISGASGAQVHDGFQSLYNRLAGTIPSDISAVLSSHTGSSLAVTGHSLGAGLAAISATQLAALGHTPTVYTFGEPRNGDSTWSSYVDSLIPSYYRVTHYNDGVPQIPPTSLGYVHHGLELWESLSSSNNAASTFQCPSSVASQCNSGQNYGSSPINGAHISYTNQLVATVLFNSACGYGQH